MTEQLGIKRRDDNRIKIQRAEFVQLLAPHFKEVSGVDLLYEMGPRRAGDVEAVFADATKSREVLGWACEHDLRDALRDAWNWQRSLGS